MTLKIGDVVKINHEKIAQELGTNCLDIEFKVFLSTKDLYEDDFDKLVLIKPVTLITEANCNISKFIENKCISSFIMDNIPSEWSKKCDILTKSNIGELFIWIPEDCLSLIENKTKNKLTGCFCIHCHNFSPYAENNYGEKFLCWGCNLPINKMIYGLD